MTAARPAVNVGDHIGHGDVDVLHPNVMLQPLTRVGTRAGEPRVARDVRATPRRQLVDRYRVVSVPPDEHDRLVSRADDGSRLTFTRDERGMSLSVGQVPDRSVSVRLPGAEWERVRAWGDGGDINARVSSLLDGLDELDAKYPGHVRGLLGADLCDRLLNALTETCGHPLADGELCVLAPHSEETPCRRASDVPAGAGDTTGERRRVDEITRARAVEAVGWLDDNPPDVDDDTFAALMKLMTYAKFARPGGPGDTVPRAPVEALLAELYAGTDAGVHAAVDEVQRHLDGSA